MRDPAPDWEKVERMVGLPDYGVVFCVSPWPDGGWMAGIQMTDREWVEEQVRDGQIDPAVLNVPGLETLTPNWETFDGFPDGVNAKGDDAADAIDRLWAMIHGEPNPPRRHQRK